MPRISHLLWLCVALSAIGIFADAVKADDAASGQATGTVTGRVVDADGKPVKGAHVIAIPVVPPAKAGDPKVHTAPKPLASTESAADGTYKLEAVPAGDVRVAARLENSADHAYCFTPKPKTEVVAGQNTRVDDIKLVKHAAPGGAAPRAGG